MKTLVSPQLEKERSKHFAHSLTRSCLVSQRPHAHYHTIHITRNYQQHQEQQNPLRYTSTTFQVTGFASDTPQVLFESHNLREALRPRLSTLLPTLVAERKVSIVII